MSGRPVGYILQKYEARFRQETDQIVLGRSNSQQGWIEIARLYYRFVDDILEALLQIAVQPCCPVTTSRCSYCMIVRDVDLMSDPG